MATITDFPPRREIFTEDGLPTRRFYEFLRGLSVQSDETTGEVPSEFGPEVQTFDGDDLISELDTIMPVLALDPDELESDQSIPGLNPGFVPPPLEVVGITADYTTTGDQVVICSNTDFITVTLNATPDDAEQVHIKRQGVGLVKVSGAIDGDTSKNIVLRYDAPHLVFTLEAGEWSII